VNAANARACFYRAYALKPSVFKSWDRAPLEEVHFVRSRWFGGGYRIAAGLRGRLTEPAGVGRHELSTGFRSNQLEPCFSHLPVCLRARLSGGLVKLSGSRNDTKIVERRGDV